jgi:hypothetical protein
VGLKSRRKGADGEREVVTLAHAAGLRAERTWHTSQSPDATVRCCDVRIAGQPYQVQVGKDGFERIYRELAGVRGFVLRRDRAEWLIALRLADFLALLAENKRGKHGTSNRSPNRARTGD